jgi:hypothetical protein
MPSTPRRRGGDRDRAHRRPDRLPHPRPRRGTVGAHPAARSASRRRCCSARTASRSRPTSRCPLLARADHAPGRAVPRRRRDRRPGRQPRRAQGVGGRAPAPRLAGDAPGRDEGPRPRQAHGRVGADHDDARPLPCGEGAVLRPRRRGLHPGAGQPDPGPASRQGRDPSGAVDALHLQRRRHGRVHPHRAPDPRAWPAERPRPAHGPSGLLAPRRGRLGWVRTTDPGFSTSPRSTTAARSRRGATPSARCGTARRSPACGASTATA